MFQARTDGMENLLKKLEGKMWTEPEQFIRLN